VTTTALQSLALLNHDFVLQQSENLANRISSLHDAPKDQIAVAWSLVFSRKPSELEMRVSEELIGKHGLSTFCRYLLNSNEFVSID
jgi:capsule polysaccharide export protein KpsE/RkpR